MREIFIKAKELIEKSWYPKENNGYDDCVCASTAVSMNIPYNADCRTHTRYMQFFKEVNNIPGSKDSLSAIYKWNDSPERTKDEVLQAFDKAIEACAV